MDLAHPEPLESAQPRRARLRPAGIRVSLFWLFLAVAPCALLGMDVPPASPLGIVLIIWAGAAAALVLRPAEAPAAARDGNDTGARRLTLRSMVRETRRILRRARYLVLLLAIGAVIGWQHYRYDRAVRALDEHRLFHDSIIQKVLVDIPAARRELAEADEKLARAERTLPLPTADDPYVSQVKEILTRRGFLLHVIFTHETKGKFYSTVEVDAVVSGPLEKLPAAAREVADLERPAEWRGTSIPAARADAVKVKIKYFRRLPHLQVAPDPPVETWMRRALAEKQCPSVGSGIWLAPYAGWIREAEGDFRNRCNRILAFEEEITIGLDILRKQRLLLPVLTALSDTLSHQRSMIEAVADLGEIRGDTFVLAE